MDFLRDFGTASLWIGAVLGAIASVTLQQLWTSKSPQLGAFRVRLKTALEVRRGRSAPIGAPATAGAVLPKYFRQQEDRVDLAIYELSLRPDIPIIDLLYMEYLRARLVDRTIDRVVIVPWSGWSDKQNHGPEDRIRHNLERVFGGAMSRVDVVTAAKLQERATDVFENHFFEQVGNLGNSEFLRTASSRMGYEFRSYHDINRGHPESHQARSIVEHTVRGWLIYRYIEAAYLNASSPPERIASLMWERELTKLLLLSNIIENHGDIDCSLILGGSVMYRRGLRRLPVPTYVNNETITVFGSRSAQLEVIKKKKRGELRRTNEVMCDILNSQPGLRDLPGWASDAEVSRNENELRGEALAVARSLRRLRKAYPFSHD